MHFSCVYIFVSMQNSTHREFEIQPEILLIRENYDIMARQTVSFWGKLLHAVSIFGCDIWAQVSHFI